MPTTPAAVVKNESQYLVLTLPKQLLLAQVVHTQQLPNPDQDSSLEGGDGCRNLLHGGLERKKRKAVRPPLAELSLC